MSKLKANKFTCRVCGHQAYWLARENEIVRDCVKCKKLRTFDAKKYIPEWDRDYHRTPMGSLDIEVKKQELAHLMSLLTTDTEDEAYDKLSDIIFESKKSEKHILEALKHQCDVSRKKLILKGVRHE